MPVLWERSYETSITFKSFGGEYIDMAYKIEVPLNKEEHDFIKGEIWSRFIMTDSDYLRMLLRIEMERKNEVCKLCQQK